MERPATRGIESYRDHVERVFYQMGWDNLEDIGTWSGEDLDALRELLPAEQFEALLDQLAEADAGDRQ